MPASYPNSVKTWTDKQDNIDDVFAGDINGAYAEIIAIENELMQIGYKRSVRAATTQNGDLATAFANGQTVDGVVLATGDRILIKDQTNGAENGIYIVNASGAPTRATDANSSAHMVPGLMVYVREGTVNGKGTWKLTTTGTITLGTTPLTFENELRSHTADVIAINAKIADLAGFVGYTEDDIYGVEVDFANRTFTRLAGAVGKTPGADFDSILAFGGRYRCNLTDEGVEVAKYGDTGYTETGALTQAITIEGVTYAAGTPVQVMVKQPKFYYKVVPLKLEKNDAEEIDRIEFTAGASSDGNITITLNGQNFNVAVLASENTATAIATKVRNATFNGWTTGGSGATVTFTRNKKGVCAAPTFNGGTTGVTANVARTQVGYIGKGFKLRKARYYVSMTKKAGFKVHPAFVQNGVEREFIYLSAYEGCLWDKSAGEYILNDAQIADFTVSTGDKLSSIANAKPISGLTQDLTRRKCGILAENRGNGWYQQYAATIACSQLLFTIEYASMNTQSKIGAGVTNKTDDGATSMTELTGATTNLGNASGSVTNTNGYNVVSYRGEENLWGNIWKFTDGMNVYCDASQGIHSLYIADNAFVESKNTDNYKDAGITLATKEGYVSAMAYNEEFDWLFVPAETLGDSALPVGDYFYQNVSSSTGYRIARLGGNWYSGSNAGAFYWYVNDAPSSRYRHIGGRLVYVPPVAA